jgi:hypothetical protein
VSSQWIGAGVARRFSVRTFHAKPVSSATGSPALSPRGAQIAGENLHGGRRRRFHRETPMHGPIFPETQWYNRDVGWRGQLIV